MTQEEKELLLIDLSARLTYGVICTDNRHGDSRIFNIDIEDKSVYYTDFDEYGLIENCKPYLRPMSSMTREEEAYWKYHRCMVGDGVYRLGYDNPVFCIFECFEWLNSHHFDYGGFIEKGLALEAPEGMYD